MQKTLTVGTVSNHLGHTNHTRIFAMGTPVRGPCLYVVTVEKRGFSSLTIDIIHPDITWSLTVCCTNRSGGRIREAKLTANHICIINIPFIIAHCAPDSFQVNLHTAIVGSAIYETYSRAFNTGVLAVSAVAVSPSLVRTVGKVSLISCACHIIHPDWTGSLTMSSSAERSRGLMVAKLLANHFSVIYIPSIIANCSPLTIIEDFNSSSCWRIAIQADTSTCDG